MGVLERKEDEETNLEEIQFHLVRTRSSCWQQNYLKQENEELHIRHLHTLAAGGQMAISELFQGVKHGESESGIN